MKLGLRRIILNSSSIVLIRPLSFVANLVIIPIFLKKYGDVNFGIYSQWFGLASAIVIFDFGTQTTLVKTVAESRVHFSEKLYGVYRNTRTINFLSGVVFGAALWFIGAFLADLFKILPADREFFRQCAMAAGVASFAIINSMPYSAAMDGYELHMVRNFSSLSPTVFLLILILLIEPLDLDVYTVAVLSILSLSLPGLINSFVCAGLGIPFGGKYAEYRQKAEPLSLAQFFLGNRHIFSSQFLAFLSSEGQRVLIGVMFGPVAVSLYTTAQRPLFLFKILTSQIALPLMPKIVQLTKTNDLARRDGFVWNAQLTLILVQGSLLGAALVLLKPFYLHWVPSPPANLFPVGALIALTFYCAAGSGLLSRALTFSGHANLISESLAKTSVVGMILAVGLGFLLGLEGVLIGFLVQSYLNYWLVRKQAAGIYPTGKIRAAQSAYHLVGVGLIAIILICGSLPIGWLRESFWTMFFSMAVAGAALLPFLYLKIRRVTA